MMKRSVVIRTGGSLSHPLPQFLPKQVARLGLRKSEYATSVTLRRWCDQNRNRVYVPEWLLIEWVMNVGANITDAA
jgi:hypothetical protein